MLKLERNCEVLRLLVPRHHESYFVMPSNARDMYVLGLFNYWTNICNSLIRSFQMLLNQIFIAFFTSESSHVALVFKRLNLSVSVLFYFIFRNKEEFLTLLNKNSDKLIPLNTIQDVNDQTPSQVCFNLDFLLLALLEKCVFR